MSTSSAAASDRSISGAQTVHRALDIVELVAAQPRGVSLTEVATALDVSAPTVHRVCRTLVERGYLRQLADRRYTLGSRLVPLGTAARRLTGVDAETILADLVSEIGETANLAVLTGYQAEYVAQAPSQFSMRMFTEVGRRVDLHSTGVGKALLAQLDDPTVESIILRAGMTKRTEHTIATSTALAAALDEVRRLGYALDAQEQELGVICVAVAVPTPPPAWMAVSVSGPLTRMTPDVLARAVPLLQSGSRRLAANLDQK